MKTDTQQLIIIILGVIAIICILKNTYTQYVGYIVVGLVAFLAPKTLTDKQSEIIEEQTITQHQSGGEDVQ